MKRRRKRQNQLESHLRMQSRLRKHMCFRMHQCGYVPSFDQAADVLTKAQDEISDDSEHDDIEDV